MHDSIVLEGKRIVDFHNITDISDILDIQQNNIRMFCFTLNLKNREIINVLREYSKENRHQVLQEIESVHSRIANYIEKHGTNA